VSPDDRPYRAWKHCCGGGTPSADLRLPGIHPLLEETGLIGQQTGNMPRRAPAAGESGGKTVSGRCPWRSNLSARQSPRTGPYQNIRDINSKLTRSRRELEVEITESSVMTNAEEATRTLEYLESLGVQAAIDDFPARGIPAAAHENDAILGLFPRKSR